MAEHPPPPHHPPTAPQPPNHPSPGTHRPDQGRAARSARPQRARLVRLCVPRPQGTQRHAPGAAGQGEGGGGGDVMRQMRQGRARGGEGDAMRQVPVLLLLLGEGRESLCVCGGGGSRAAHASIHNRKRQNPRGGDMGRVCNIMRQVQDEARTGRRGGREGGGHYAPGTGAVCVCGGGELIAAPLRPPRLRCS